MSGDESENGELENSPLEQAAKVLNEVANELASWSQAHRENPHPSCVFRAVSREINRIRYLRDKVREQDKRVPG